MFLILIKIHFTNLFVHSLCFFVSKAIFAWPSVTKIFLLFSSIKFSVLPSTLGPWSIFVHCCTYYKVWIESLGCFGVVVCFFFLNGYLIVSVPFIEKIILFHWITMAFLLKINWSFMCGSGLYSVPPSDTSVFSPLSHCVEFCSFTASLKVW